MASKIKSILPATIHTLGNRLTNPWSGKAISGVGTTHTAEQLVENYYPHVQQNKIRGTLKILLKPRSNCQERTIPTIPKQ